ncbi:MAG: hypothetical protein ACYDDE_00045 [bacterium]
MQPREVSFRTFPLKRVGTYRGFIVSSAICSHSEGKQAVFYSRRHLDGSSGIAYH